MYVKDLQPNTEDDLFQVLKAEWKALSVTLLQKLVDSMPNRIAAVVKARDMQPNIRRGRRSLKIKNLVQFNFLLKNVLFIQIKI